MHVLGILPSRTSSQTPGLSTAHLRRLLCYPGWTVGVLHPVVLEGATLASACSASYEQVAIVGSLKSGYLPAGTSCADRRLTQKSVNMH